MENQQKIDYALSAMKKCLDEDDLVSFKNLIIELDIKDPISGSKNWTDIKQFNLMFSTALVQILSQPLRFFKTRNCSRYFC